MIHREFGSLSSQNFAFLPFFFPPPLCGKTSQNNGEDIFFRRFLGLACKCDVPFAPPPGRRTTFWLEPLPPPRRRTEITNRSLVCRGGGIDIRIFPRFSGSFPAIFPQFRYFPAIFPQFPDIPRYQPKANSLAVQQTNSPTPPQSGTVPRLRTTADRQKKAAWPRLQCVHRPPQPPFRWGPPPRRVGHRPPQRGTARSHRTVRGGGARLSHGMHALVLTLKFTLAHARSHAHTHSHNHKKHCLVSQIHNKLSI